MSRVVWAAWALTVLAAFAGGLLAPRGRAPAPAEAGGAREELVEELSGISRAYSRSWDERRDLFAPGPERDAERERHRRAYAKEVREAHERRGKAPPPWAVAGD